MYPNLRHLTLLGIFSLTLLSLTGCGEKRVHVATFSGAPGDELILDPMTGNVEPQSTSGLNDASIDESALLAQTTDGKENSDEPTGLSNQDETFTELMDSNSPVASLAEGQDFSTQSSSSSGEQFNPSQTHIENFQEPTTAQDFFTGLNDTLSGDGMEPVPDTFQIAKAEPSDSLQDQMKRIKEEEFARMARLQDVFFQFDSWSLTPEGKQALEQTQKWFEQAPSSNLIIEGHADQRGTQAYNMVLAKKRAVTVQSYLSELGVDDSRMAIISYGKDKPFCQDVTEACHQLNRRGHLLVPIQ